MNLKAHTPSLSNLTFCAKFTQDIDLPFLAKQWFESESIECTLLPIPRALIRYSNGIAVNISPKGSIVLLGKIHPNEAEKIIFQLQKTVSKYFKRNISFSQPPRIASLLASAKLPYQIDIAQLIQKVPKCTRSKRNPGIWWKINKFGIKSLGIFASGSIKMCGMDRHENFTEIYEQLVDYFYQFRKLKCTN